MKFQVLFVFILFYLNAFSQLTFEKTNHDFGNLDANSERYIDIEVNNKGSKKEYFLSFRKPKDLVCLSKGEFILPDSTSFIRIQVNPVKKGKFTYELEIFTSDRNEATKIKVTGNITELPENLSSAYQSCPDFTAKPSGKRNPSNKFTIKTLDAAFNSPVDATVFILQNGTDFLQITTKNGSWTGKIPLGFTYFLAKSESYKKLDTNAYINANRNEMVLKLYKDPSYCLPVPQEKQIVPEKVEEIKVEKEKVLTELEMKQALTEELRNQSPTKSDSSSKSNLDSIPLENFDSKYFKPVNVVFVLDISTSMGNSEKFDLLKFSLIQLLDILRPQDKIALVTYATEAKVLLASSSGNEKEKILAVIKKLKASGKTAGMAGLKLGFSEVEKNFIADGTNLVVVITDGAFNKENGNYLKLIEKQRAKNIQFSVVGVKNTPKDEVNMREAAKAGNGAYVPVFKLVDAQQNVIREIKRASFKNRD